VPTGRILLVEDRESLRRMLERALAAEGYEVVAAADGESGIARLRERSFDLVLTDLKLPAASGLEVLAASRETHPELPVVVLTAYGTVRSAVEAMRLGAVDFLEKPVEIDELFALVAALVAGGGDDEVFEVAGGPVIVGRHPSMRSALRLLEKVAPTDSTVLLTGESGTGKELFARALHGLSSRSSGPFVAVNCAAIPEGLLESELFGHEKGAFTGAHRRRSGRFQQAAGGTLLLDEIGELTAAIQGKVLRVLEERTFERVGGSATIAADARLVAATNRDLAAMVAAGDFRSDLFYRLDIFPIELPPLAERTSDVPLLARYLLARLAARHQRPVPSLADDAADLLAAQEWPGNVRQLANLLERAVILSEGPRRAAAGARSPAAGGRRQAPRGRAVGPQLPDDAAAGGRARPRGLSAIPRLACPSHRSSQGDAYGVGVDDW
jgi:DNA-binding NtrC family response regulator